MRRRQPGEPSLQQRIVRYLKTRPGVRINGGELERLAMEKNYKASNASRRCRVLEEASRGLSTTGEHLLGKKLLEGGVIRSAMKGGSIWYWYEDNPGQA